MGALSEKEGDRLSNAIARGAEDAGGRFQAFDEFDLSGTEILPGAGERTVPAHPFSEHAGDFLKETPTEEEAAAATTATPPAAPAAPAGPGDIGFEAPAAPKGFDTPQAQAYNAFIAANPNATADDIRAFATKNLGSIFRTPTKSLSGAKKSGRSGRACPELRRGNRRFPGLPPEEQALNKRQTDVGAE